LTEINKGGALANTMYTGGAILCRTYEDVVELAKICLAESRVTKAPQVAAELYRMGLSEARCAS
jgi:hypothetical protein